MRRFALQRLHGHGNGHHCLSFSFQNIATVAAAASSFSSELQVVPGRLQHLIEEHGHSVASLSAQVKANKTLLFSVLSDVETLKAQYGNTDCKGLPDDVVLELRDGSLGFSNPLAADDDEHRDLAISKLRCHKESCNVLQDGGDVVATCLKDEESSCRALPHLPQWKLFLDHLRSFAFFDAQQGEICNSKTVRRALSKFSQEYGWIFDSLSLKHLRILAEYGCPTDDRRTIAAGKRLRSHLCIQENDICEPCELRGMCRSAFVKPANIKPNLSDVLRLIYSMFEDSPCKKGAVPDNVSWSVTHILKEITDLSSTHGNGSGSVQQDPELQDQNAALGEDAIVRDKEEKLCDGALMVKTIPQNYVDACSSNKVSSFSSKEQIRGKAEVLEKMLVQVQNASMQQCAKEEETEDMLSALNNVNAQSTVSDNTVGSVCSISSSHAKIGQQQNQMKGQLAKCVKGEENEDMLSDSSNANAHSKVFDNIVGSFPSTFSSQAKLEEVGLDAHTHPAGHCFGDIVEFGNMPLTKGNNCSLSELVKQNMGAFVSSRQRSQSPACEETKRAGREDNHDSRKSYRSNKQHEVDSDNMVTNHQREHDRFHSRTMGRHSEDSHAYQGFRADRGLNETQRNKHSRGDSNQHNGRKLRSADSMDEQGRRCRRVVKW